MGNGPTYDLSAIISNGYGTGRKIGNDFASSRYSRAESKLRQAILQEAEEKGVDPETLYQKYEDATQALADKKGVTRRNITNEKGETLAEASALGFKQNLQQRARMRAGEKMAGGDLEGGARALSGSNYRLGDIEGGMKLGQGADTIHATSSALGKDGTYDEVAGAKNMTGVSAKYGDAAGAEAGKSKTVEMMNKQADTLYGRAATFLAAGTDEGNEAALGYINTALSQFDTRWGSDLQMRYDRANDEFALMKGEQMMSRFAASKAPQLLETFVADPSKVLEQSRGARAGNAAKDDERRAKKDENYLAAATDLVKEMTKQLGDATVAKNITTAAAAATKAKWEFLGDSRSAEDGSTQQSARAPDGSLVTLVFNKPDDESGPGAQLTILDTSGQAVPGDSFEAVDAVQQYMGAQSVINSSANAATVNAALKQGIGVLHSLYYGGDAFPREKGKGAESGAIRSADDVWDRMTGDKGIESGGKQHDNDGNPLTSPKGAIGAAQVMPETARKVAKDNGITWSEDKYKNDKTYNMKLGKLYFDEQLQKYDGDTLLAAAAYNAGPGAVDKWIQKFGDPRTGEISYSDFAQKIPYKETRNYVQTVALGSPKKALPDRKGVPTAIAKTDDKKPVVKQKSALGETDKRTLATRLGDFFNRAGSNIEARNQQNREAFANRGQAQRAGVADIVNSVATPARDFTRALGGKPQLDSPVMDPAKPVIKSGFLAGTTPE